MEVWRALIHQYVTSHIFPQHKKSVVVTYRAIASTVSPSTKEVTDTQDSLISQMSIFEFIVKLQLVKGIPELFLREPYRMQDTRNRYSELQELTSLPPLCFASSLIIGRILGNKQTNKATTTKTGGGCWGKFELCMWFWADCNLQISSCALLAFGSDMFLMIIATLTQKIHSLHSLPTNSSQNHPSSWQFYFCSSRVT